jgi:hypothetical protein
LTRSAAYVKGNRQCHWRDGRSLDRRSGMAELEAAERHLSAALQRLQAALSRRGNLPAASVAGDLPDDVVALQEECQTLREVAGHVSQRLDRSIHELDRLLGE